MVSPSPAIRPETTHTPTTATEGVLQCCNKHLRDVGRFVAGLDRPPSEHDVLWRLGQPTYKSCIQQFGSFEAFIEAATSQGKKEPAPLASPLAILGKAKTAAQKEIDAIISNMRPGAFGTPTIQKLGELARQASEENLSAADFLLRLWEINPNASDIFGNMIRPTNGRRKIAAVLALDLGINRRTVHLWQAVLEKLSRLLGYEQAPLDELTARIIEMRTVFQQIRALAAAVEGGTLTLRKFLRQLDRRFPKPAEVLRDMITPANGIRRDASQLATDLGEDGHTILHWQNYFTSIAKGIGLQAVELPGKAGMAHKNEQTRANIDALVATAKAENWSAAQFADALQKIDPDWTKVFHNIAIGPRIPQTVLAKRISMPRTNMSRLVHYFKGICKTLDYAIQKSTGQSERASQALALAAIRKRFAAVVVIKAWSIEKVLAGMAKIDPLMAQLLRNLYAPADGIRMATKTLVRDAHGSEGSAQAFEKQALALGNMLGWEEVPKEGRARNIQLGIKVNGLAGFVKSLDQDARPHPWEPLDLVVELARFDPAVEAVFTNMVYGHHGHRLPQKQIAALLGIGNAVVGRIEEVLGVVCSDQSWEVKPVEPRPGKNIPRGFTLIETIPLLLPITLTRELGVGLYRWTAPLHASAAKFVSTADDIGSSAIAGAATFLFAKHIVGLVLDPPQTPIESLVYGYDVLGSAVLLDHGLQKAAWNLTWGKMADPLIKAAKFGFREFAGGMGASLVAFRTMESATRRLPVSHETAELINLAGTGMMMGGAREIARKLLSTKTLTTLGSATSGLGLIYFATDVACGVGDAIKDEVTGPYAALAADLLVTASQRGDNFLQQAAAAVVPRSWYKLTYPLTDRNFYWLKRCELHLKDGHPGCDDM